MDFINEIKEETIIICNKYVKEKILNTHLLVPIKIMNIFEFRDKYYFSYNEDAILFIMKEYNVKYNIASEYIDALYYISDKSYNIKKLDFLIELRHKLDENNLLKYNINFINYVRRTPIIIYGINLDKFTAKMFKGLNYRVIERDYQKYTHEIFEFESIDEEVHYVASCIAKLVDAGISIKKIKLTNVDESYYNTINRIFSLYNLKVNIKYKTSLICYDIVRHFLNYYEDNKNIEEILVKLDHDNLLYDELVKVINKYLKYENGELLKYKIENSYITSNVYSNGIDIIDYLEYIPNDDEHFFMLGFNDSLIPKYYMDTEYITDNIKDNTDLENTRILNKNLKEDALKAIDNFKNLTITYKLKDNNSIYYPSTLCSYYKTIRKEIDYIDSYSQIYDEILLTRRYDEYFKYGHKSHDFDLLNNNYDIKYNSYSNKFTGIVREVNLLKLSYSKMKIYNLCAFRYYIANILKLDIYQKSFSSLIGDIVHYVMEKCLSNKDEDTDKYLYEYIKSIELTKKEKFFIDKYRIAIKELLAEVIKEREYLSFNHEMYEKEITIDYGNNVYFTGKIDKILYYESNNNTYVALVDYKTGNDDISLNFLDYGINIQLPIYLFLTEHIGFNNIKYTGFYLQKLNITDNDYRLIGYSNSDKDTLKVIDKEYANSKIIKGLKLKNDGDFYNYSKVLNDDEIRNIITKIKKIINNVIENIKNNQFPINPKVYNDTNISCEYCHFNDICFKTVNDEITITKNNIGGMNNGIYQGTINGN